MLPPYWQQPEKSSKNLINSSMGFEITNTVLLWFGIAIVLFLVEMAVPGFILMFFGIGALLTSILLALGIIDSFFAQILVFVISSLVSLISFRLIWKGDLRGDVSHERRPGEKLEDVKGKKARVLSEIKPGNLGGKVELFGTVWEAESDFFIEEGKVVEIVDRENLVLKVKPFE